ncbi:hemicentin-1-like [Macrobrachium nipponense]|uniref:hemicentin-1-like n=1 Tax=Macrobrachium nipponense TaxID=159736 RepID=UPI0030C8A7C5
MDPRISCHLLAIVVFLYSSVLVTSRGNGWKDETDWGQIYEKGSHPRKGPHLLPGLPTNVTVLEGRSATLPCSVANLKGRSVSWIRKEDLKILATDGVAFTSDQRMKAHAWRTGVVWELDLQIAPTTIGDAGVYECQVNTRPKISHLITLRVYDGRAKIVGPSEIFLEAGSPLVLNCRVDLPQSPRPEPPPTIRWFQGVLPLNPDDDSGETSYIQTAQEGSSTVSVLSLSQVSSRDAGNFTCVSGTSPEGATVTVYVLQEKEPRAMHHDSSSSIEGNSPLTAAAVVLMMVVAAIER